MLIKETIKQLRVKEGYSQKDLGDILGVTKQAISMYERGDRTPDAEMLVKLADVFNVDLNVILGRDVQSPSIRNIRPIQKKRFPMLGEIACGQPIFASEDHESYIDASATIDADFCLTAKGDSMIGARIQDGDVVFIKQQPIVENGEIAAVVIGDEATLKTWYYYPDRQKLVLTPANQAYEPLVYTGEELNTITCLGRAVCFMSNLRKA